MRRRKRRRRVTTRKRRSKRRTFFVNSYSVMQLVVLCHKELVDALADAGGTRNERKNKSACLRGI